MSKPSIPKGTRDFGPLQVNRRNYIFNTLRRVFVKYGYQPIETPVMENLSTLTGKYGDEGDQLLFKVLNSGDFLKKVKDEDYQAGNYKKITTQLAEKGLRYDLTIPFARYVVMNRNDIVFPFKRYQIQPVWRGDRPQKGRYREFYQCDVDVVGSESLINEVELTQIYDEGFAQLGINALIKINNRKILTGIAEAAGIPDKMIDMTVAIDKIDKIGMDGVKDEMRRKEIGEEAISTIEKILKISDLDQLKSFFSESETGQKGIEELQTVFNYLKNIDLTNEIIFDITLARGLSYYTGTIYEVAAKDVQIGSIGGGGRYDDLTGMFGLKNISGVGVSFGAARIYDVMEELNIFPDSTAQGTQLLFVTFDDASFDYAFNALQVVRKAGINAEIYPQAVKMNKQMKYANARKIPYVAVVGNNEIQTGKIALKNMQTGEQANIKVADLVEKISV